jgi:hypothetical protein
MAITLSLAAQVAALEAELAGKRDELFRLMQKQEEKQKPWPQVGDEYWIIVSVGNISYRVWGGNDFDLSCQSIGNIFRTEEEAKRELEARKVIAELRAQPGRRTFVGDKGNYCIEYCAKNSSVRCNSWWSIDSGWQQINFDTAEHCDAAVATVGEARILAAMKWMGSK